mgnify:CR=1 FL=1
MIVVMISVPSHDAGLRTVNSVGAASLEGRILVEDIAMVHRTDDGEVEVHRSAPSPENRRIIGDGTQGPLAGLFSAPLAPAVAVGARAPTATRTTRAGRAIRLSGATAFLLVDEASTLTMEQAGQAMRGSEAVVFVLADEIATLTIGEIVDDEARIGYYVLPEATRRLIRPSRRAGSSRPLCDRHHARPVSGVRDHRHGLL